MSDEKIKLQCITAALQTALFPLELSDSEWWVVPLSISLFCASEIDLHSKQVADTVIISSDLEAKTISIVGEVRPATRLRRGDSESATGKGT